MVAFWEPGAATRFGLRASFASAVIAIILAVFQVQEWAMPTPLAVGLIALLFVMLAAAVAMMAYEIVAAFRRFLEHRATSSSWVSSERPGLLDYEADGIRANKRFTKELNKLTGRTEKLGTRLVRHTEVFERSKNASGKTKQRRANRSAREIDRSAVYIEKRLDLLQGLVKDIARNAEGLIGALELETEADIEMAREFRDTLVGGHQATSGTLVSVRDYRNAVKETEQLNLSRSIRIATGRLVRALEGVEKMLRKHEAESRKLAHALDTKIAEAERGQDQAARL